MAHGLSQVEVPQKTQELRINLKKRFKGVGFLLHFCALYLIYLGHDPWYIPGPSKKKLKNSQQSVEQV
jgi:hypothetical protein